MPMQAGSHCGNFTSTHGTENMVDPGHETANHLSEALFATFFQAPINILRTWRGDSTELLGKRLVKIDVQYVFVVKAQAILL